MDRMKIAQRLRELRGDRTRLEVAEAIGIQQSAIANYENGDRVPTDELKIKLAEYYGVPVGTLFFDP